MFLTKNWMGMKSLKNTKNGTEQNKNKMIGKRGTRTEQSS